MRSMSGCTVAQKEGAEGRSPPRAPPTIVISLPAAFRKALVHLTLRGFRFILKFLWHLERHCEGEGGCSVWWGWG